MNLVTHLFRKDIRRSRWLLLAWMLLLIVEGVLVSSSANPGDQVIQMMYWMITSVVPLFQALLLIILIPFVIQDEPLVGTTAFWLTRPISRGTLFRAKIWYAGAVLVLPALLVEVVVFVANGITAHEIALAVPEILLGQIKLVVVIAIVAVITPTFGKYAIVGASAVIASIVATLAIQWSRMYLHPDSFMAQAMNFSLENSRSVAVGITANVLLAAVVAFQYLTGRTRASVVAGCAAVVAILAVHALWNWDFLARPVPKTGAAPFDVSAVKVALGSNIEIKSASEKNTDVTVIKSGSEKNTDFTVVATSVGDVPEMRSVAPAQKEVEARLETSGVPARYTLRVKHIRPHLKLPDGQEVEVTEPPNFQIYQQTNLNAEALAAGLGGTPVVNLKEAPEDIPLFMIDAASYGKDYDQPLAFSAEIDFTVSEYQITAEMPLVKGARFDRESKHSIITDVLHQPVGVDVVLRERTTNLLFDRSNGGHQFGAMQDIISGNRPVYVLRNKKRNEAVVPRRDLMNISFDQMFRQSRLVNQAVRISFRPDSYYEEATPGPPPEWLTPEWLADAELIRLDRTPVFEFSKPLAVEGFKMKSGKP